MVLKSTKSKSKRSTLRHKYKVIRKVKEHHKKKLKEEKNRKKAGLKPRRTKDPGIPAQWPFKEELLKDLEWQKQRILAQEKAKREENKLKRAAERAAQAGNDEAADPSSAQALLEAAEAKQKSYAANKKARWAKPEASADKDLEEKNLAQLNPARAAADGSRRAFYKEFVKVVAASDVVVQVLDARDPLGSRCEEVEAFVRRSGAGKRVLLLLNKIDLVPKEVAEAWLKYLREEMPAVAFKCSTQQQGTSLKQNRSLRTRRGKATPMSSAPQVSTSLGADTLMQLLKNYARSADIKVAITVGIVGLPNVGKSSVINSLKRAKVAQVGNAPGVTRTMQQISLDRNINLLDSPGITFSAGHAEDAWAALRNCIRVEQLADPKAIAAEIVKRCPAKQLMLQYRVPAFKDADEFLQHVAFRRGQLLPGGVGDAATAARVVLHDWHNGKIAYYTMPPERKSGAVGTAELVTDWAKDFDADKVFANERSAVIAGLPSLEDNTRGFVRTETAGTTPGMASFEGVEVTMHPNAHDSSDSESDAEPAMPPLALLQPRGQQQNAAGPAVHQTEKLYQQAGQFNPHAARAEKKRKKRESKLGLGDDFDFAEAFADEVQISDGN